MKSLHLAIIMDGNGRWATCRNLPRVAGHREGIAAVRRIVEHAGDIGLRCLTLYAFSSDNWRRPAAEVTSLFWLLRAYLRLETKRLRDRGVRLQVVGRRDRLPAHVLREIDKAQAATAGGSGLHLRIAIDYSARDAIARAATQSVLTNPEALRQPDRLRAMMAQSLTEDCGEVDLLIRTGGEKRLSDFLLWECAYAELVFIDRMWPEFDAADLDAAIAEFNHRERRFGTVPAPATVLTDCTLPQQIGVAP